MNSAESWKLLPKIERSGVNVSGVVSWSVVSWVCELTTDNWPNTTWTQRLRASSWKNWNPVPRTLSWEREEILWIPCYTWENPWWMSNGVEEQIIFFLSPKYFWRSMVIYGDLWWNLWWGLWWHRKISPQDQMFVVEVRGCQLVSCQLGEWTDNWQLTDLAPPLSELPSEKNKLW